MQQGLNQTTTIHIYLTFKNPLSKVLFKSVWDMFWKNMKTVVIPFIKSKMLHKKIKRKHKFAVRVCFLPWCASCFQPYFLNIFCHFLV